MIPDRMITLLSGGTGTPKLLLGIRKYVPDSDLTIIGNTGDDDTFYGLLVSPDVDTILYLFSGQLDLEKFWGIIDDSYILLHIFCYKHLRNFKKILGSNLVIKT
ncbi:MAG: 2-phospho-L-lactate transferase CofD family protein [Candidatus Heimdallarchaeota archaeon]